MGKHAGRLRRIAGTHPYFSHPAAGAPRPARPSSNMPCAGCRMRSGVERAEQTGSVAVPAERIGRSP